jgi:hypothetical protein
MPAGLGPNIISLNTTFDDDHSSNVPGDKHIRLPLMDAATKVQNLTAFP